MNTRIDTGVAPAVNVLLALLEECERVIPELVRQCPRGAPLSVANLHDRICAALQPLPRTATGVAPDLPPEHKRQPDQAARGSLRAPDGTPISGSYDTLKATAHISSAERNPDGSLSIDWAGDSDIDWDSQETFERHGQRVFVDENGVEWLECDLHIVPDEEAES